MNEEEEDDEKGRAGGGGGEEEGKDKYASTHESEINVLITQRGLIGDYHASLDT